MEPIDINLTIRIAKHFGLCPIRIRGTSQVNIAKATNPVKYENISWEEFAEVLEEKGLSVYKDSSSCFLKIMKKKA